MDLTEIRAAAQEALGQANAAMGTINDFVREALIAAFEAMHAIEGHGPIAVNSSGHPYDYAESRNRLSMVSDLMLAVQSALETAAEYAHRASNQITDARTALDPVRPEGFALVNSAYTALDEADGLLSDLFEIDGPILPITAQTATFRLGQAVGSLQSLIDMMS